MASFTSCTLRIFAPFNNAMVFAEVVAFNAKCGVISKGLYNIDFLEIPTKIGASKFLKSDKFLIIRNCVRWFFQNQNQHQLVHRLLLIDVA